MKQMNPHLSRWYFAAFALSCFGTLFLFAICAEIVIAQKVSRVQVHGRRVIALNSAGKRVWAWSGSNPVTDAMIGWKGYVYLTALDGNLIALTQDGREMWSNFLNGSGQYVQVERYGVDGIAAKIDASAYREKFHDFSIPDEVQIWRRNKFICSVEFPANARLVVYGSSLYAVFRRHSILRRRLIPQCSRHPTSPST
jgi:hypothetical protein